MPSKGKYQIPEHVFTPDPKRLPHAWKMCVHCNPKSSSTYAYRFSPEKHLFDLIIQEEP